MADIVRMGRPHSKASNAPNASHHNVLDPSTTELLHNQSEASSVQQVPVIDEWPSIEKPAPANVISVPEYAVDSELHPEASPDSDNHHYEAEEVPEGEEDKVEVLENDSEGALLFENELYRNMGSYHSEAPDFERHEGDCL